LHSDTVLATMSEDAEPQYPSLPVGSSIRSHGFEPYSSLPDVNPAIGELMGYSREELIRMHLTVLHPESERERAKVEFQKAAEHPSRHRGFHMRRKNGSYLSLAI